MAVDGDEQEEPGKADATCEGRGPSAAEAVDKQPAPTAGEAATGEGTDRGPKPSPAPKRQRVAQWEEIDCGAAGHCFYNCVTAGFVLKTTRTAFEDIKGGLNAKGRGLRSRVASYIQGHEERFKPYFEPSCVSPDSADPEAEAAHLLIVADGTPPATWQQYLEAIWRPARWADEISFRAAAALLGISLQLVCGSLDKPEQVLSYVNPKSAITLYLRYSLGHYTLLLPRGDKLPDYIRQEAVAQTASQTFAPRGGGKRQLSTVCLGLGAMDDSWIPAHVSSEEEGAPRKPATCPDKPRPSPAGSMGQRTHHAGSAKSQPWQRNDKGKRRSCQLAKQRSQRMKGISLAVSKARQKHCTVGRRKQWTCNVCDVVVKAGSMRQLSIGRYGHIKRVHPRVPLDRFTDVRAFIPVTPTVLDLDQPAWMCAWCHTFLPRLDTPYALTKSAKAHLQCCDLAPDGVTLSQNLREILTAEGIEPPARAADLCQTFGRKIDLGQYRPAAKELKELTAERQRDTSLPVRRALASRRCVMGGSQQAQDKKGRGASQASASSAPGEAKGHFHHALRPASRGMAPSKDLTTEASHRFRVALKPPPQDGGWVRDLTAENIEPNPGPSTTASRRLSVTTWNAQGHRNIFEALAVMLFRGADVVLLQEVNLSVEKRKEIIIAASARGYHSFFSESTAGTDSTGRELHRGGLAVLARQELPARQVGNARVNGVFETLCVRLGCFGLLVNCHLKPRGDWQQCRVHLEELQQSEDHVLLGGDFNLLPTEVQVAGMGHPTAPRDSQGHYKPTRVDGHRCIDFFLGKSVDLAEAQCDCETLSDHLPVSVAITVPCETREQLLQLRPTTFYGLPREATAEEFTQGQHEFWQQQPMLPDQGDTEAEWQWFCQTAEQACRHATAKYESIRDPPHRRPKGSGYSTIDRAAINRGGSEAHAFQMRRLLKLQGRVREWQRQARLGTDTTVLKTCVRRTWLQQCGELPESPAEAEHAITASVAEVQATQAREAIHRWQQSLATRGKEATRWLKGKKRRITGVTGTVPGQPQGVLSTAASLEHIHAFWMKIWERPGVQHSQALQAWRRHGLHRRCDFLASQVWKPEALQRAAAAKASSAHGVDGWRGDEVKYWPKAAWTVYSTLLCRWAARGRFPAAWQAMRQVQVPKAEANDLTGEIAASDLRPIVVMSILWRIASSTVASSPQVQAWQQEVLTPEQFGGVHGRHIHHGIGKLAGPHARGLPLTSLDYAKCFDYVHPQLACDVLAAAGQWTQGRGLAPPRRRPCALALNVLMSAPSRQIADRFGDRLQQCIFLDDRAFTTEARLVPEVLQAWQWWSEQFGLRENSGKRAIVCSRGPAVEALRRDGLGQWLKDFTSSPAVPRVTSASRFAEALRLGRKLLARSIALDVRRDLWRTRVVPLAAWGHLFTAPAQEDLKEFRTLGKAVLYSHRAASVRLQRLLEGHNMDLAFQSGMHALRSLHSSLLWKDVARAQGLGTWFSRVRGFLVDMGWHPESSTVFTSGQARLDFEGDRASSIAHRIRAQWRSQLLEQFRASGRRDATQLAGWRPGTASVRLAIKLYQAAPAERKAVLSGAACSTAYYQKRQTGGAAQQCVWCGAAVAADWEHLAWQCSAMLDGAERPARPTVITPGTWWHLLDDDKDSRRRKGDDDDGCWHGSTSTWCQRASNREEQNFTDMIMIKKKDPTSLASGSEELVETWFEEEAACSGQDGLPQEEAEASMRGDVTVGGFGGHCGCMSLDPIPSVVEKAQRAILGGMMLVPAGDLAAALRRCAPGVENARMANPGGMRMVPVVDSATARSERARAILAGVTAILRGNKPGNIAHVNRPDGQPGRDGWAEEIEILRASLVRADGSLLPATHNVAAPRGGGRDEGAFLQALQQLVATFCVDGAPADAKGPPKGAGKAGKDKGKGEGKPAAGSIDEKQLLAAITRLCSVIESAKAMAEASAVKQSFYTSRATQSKAAGDSKAQGQVEHILVKNPDQATALRDMARVNEVQGKVALLCPGELGEAAKKCDVTCVKGERREVKQWHAVPLTREGCPEPPVVRRQSSFKPPARDLQTLRVQAAKAFMHDEVWRALQGCPREVVGKLLGVKPHKAEGWKLVTGKDCDPYFVGYVTFVTTEAAKVLEQSGKNGLFSEPLARDQAARPMVQWVDPEGLVGISYLRKCLQAAAGKALALRKGQGSCLGIRARKGEAVKAVSTWRVRGVPRSWSDADIVDALQGAAFLNVTVLGEAQGSRPWLVRAELADDRGELAMLVEAGDKTLRIERVVGRQKAETFREKQWQPPRKGQGKAQGKGRTDTGSPEPVDNAEAMAVDGDEQEEPGQADATSVGRGPSATEAEVKQPASTADEAATGEGNDRGPKPSPAPKRQRVAQWEEIECGAAGHCFYNCVTAGFVLKTTRTAFEDIKDDLNAKGRGLRSRVASYIQGHEERFKPFFEPSCVSPDSADPEAEAAHLLIVEDGTPPATWQQYLEAIWRPARWADEISFRAAAALLGISLQLVCGRLDKPDQVLSYVNPKSAITLYLRYSLGHYTLLLPKGDKLPDYIRQEAVAQTASQTFAPRGGGKRQQSTVGLGLDAMDDSWIPAHVSSEEEGAPRKPATSPDKPRPTPAGSRGQRTQHAGPAKSQPRQRNDKGKRRSCQLAKQRSQRMKGVSLAVSKARQKHCTVGRRKQWTCNVCDVVIKAGSMRQLSIGRYGHIKRVHPRVPLDRFTDVRSYIPVTPTVLDVDQPAWMCAWCHTFLPRLDTPYALNKSAKAHLKRCVLAPGGATLSQNLREILTAEGIEPPARAADLCQTFGRKIDLEQYRPAAKELKELTAERQRDTSLPVRRALASRSCVMGGSQQVQCKKRRSASQAPASSAPGHFHHALRSAPGGMAPGKDLTTEAGHRFRVALKPPPQDGGWVRDLTAENIEPNPGPSTTVSRKLSVTTWNAQGHGNIFEALAVMLFRGADVVLLQEVNLSVEKRKEIIIAASARGYHSFSPSPRPAPTARVGNCIEEVGNARVNGVFETLCVRLGCFGLLVNCHLKPRGDWQQCRVHLEELQQSEDRVLLGGFNLLPTEVQVAGMGHPTAPRDSQGHYKPTRVDGHRCIDFFLGKSVGLGEAQCDCETLSDHLPVSVDITVPCETREQLLQLRPTTFYGLPREATDEEFTQGQHEYWQQQPMLPDLGDTEAEWQWFCQTAEQACRHATAKYESIRDPPHRRPKGSGYSTIERAAINRGGSEAHAFQMRRLLKLQGRVREWQRQARLGTDTTVLKTCVRRTWLQQCGELPESPAEAEHAITASIAEVQATQAREAIHRWQQRLASRGKEATRWLKGKKRRITGVTGTVPGQPQGVLSTAASLEHIHAFWKKIWERPGVQRSQALQAWRRHGLHRRCDFQASQVWKPEALQRAAAAKASSAQGVDGWRGDEVKYWPKAAWTVYSTLLCRWAARGRFPAAWQAMRQVQVPKAEASDLTGEIAASDLRPIVVMSILWRIASSTVASSPQIQAWQQEVLTPEQFGGVHGRHIHLGLGKLAGPHARGLPLTSLDYAKCFDYVHPQLACDVLVEAGFPPVVVRMLRHTWTQTRYLELNGCTQVSGHQVEASLPQGDGLAPLALNVLMSAPSRQIADRFGDRLQQCIFLDDRAFTTEARLVPEVLQAWQWWSEQFGLRENNGKRAIVCARGLAADALRRDGLGQWLKQQTRVLGVDFTSSPAVPRVTSANRFAEALRLGRKLLARSIALDVRRDLWRTRVVPLP
ncbi:pol [Symbiodinium necroappetens]|uniref:Pol protein n=1 Tax=Symbiodinium necroappetens TaxID=1628268 RepID=A0A812MCH1_9DINO|nr:pol [Symbiodinium necroappetens]